MALATSDLFDVFLRSAEAEGTTRALSLEPLVLDCVADASKAWPSVRLAPEVFVRHMAERLPKDLDVETALRSMHTRDLYLAVACAKRVDGAVDVFRSNHHEEMIAVLRRAAVRSDDAEDVAQGVWSNVLLAPLGKTPRVAQYRATGPLRRWFRVAATRLVLNAVTRGRKDALGRDDDIAIAAALAPTRDASAPDARYMRALYGAKFREIFPIAFAMLTVRERRLLRMHYLDHVTLDALARLESVHRATVKRQLASGRDRLMATFRFELSSRLRVDDEELDSILRMLESQFEESVGGWLEEIRE